MEPGAFATDFVASTEFPSFSAPNKLRKGADRAGSRPGRALAPFTAACGTVSAIGGAPLRAAPLAPPPTLPLTRRRDVGRGSGATALITCEMSAHPP